MQTTDNLNDLLGPPLGWDKVTVPQRQPLIGHYVSLEPLDPQRHAASLYAVSHDANTDSHLWLYMPYGPFASLEAYAAWLQANATNASDPLFFAVVPRRGATGEAAKNGEAQGTVALMRVTREHGTIEIGNVWYGPALQKTPAATEAIYLLLRHAFALGFRRVEWKCNALNQPSRRAALRFGFSFEGVFRSHMVIKNRNRDTAWFAMLDTEWPRYRAAFESWLAPANFDDQNHQRQTLTDFRPA